MTPPKAPNPGDDPGVLSGLSRTRPQRRSAKRAARPAGAAPEASTTTPGTSAARPKAAAGPKAAAKSTAGAKPNAPAKPKAAAKPKIAAAAKGARKPKSAARPAAKAGATAKAATAPKAAARTAPRPVPRDPVMAPPERPSVPTEPVAASGSSSSGVELVAQAIQAAGEVANLGLGLGRQVAKGVLSRLPRP